MSNPDTKVIAVYGDGGRRVVGPHDEEAGIDYATSIQYRYLKVGSPSPNSDFGGR